MEQTDRFRQTIVLAGAGGDLGDRIARALVQRGADVRALVRSNTPAAKKDALTALGVTPVTIDYDDERTNQHHPWQRQPSGTSPISSVEAAT